jgi:RNA polymerase sigma-70 factor (ECF subfamily)
MGVLIRPTEMDLVRTAQSGDRAAFAELLAPEYASAFRLAYALLQSVDEAEDAVQEAAFAAWRKIASLRDATRLRAWFLAIVANECRSVKRSRWWAMPKGEPPEVEASAPDLAASIDLRRALRRIGHDERLVLVLRYYLDLSFEDIALTIGATPKAARHRVERAIQRLRPLLRVREASV